MFNERIRIASVALCVVLVGLTAALADHEEATRDVSKRLTFSGGRVSIDNRFGSVTVRTHGGNTVEMKASIRAQAETLSRAQEVLNEVRVVADDGPSGVTIRTEYPDKSRRNVGFGVDYQLTIPAAAPLVVRNRFGTVDVSGVRANADIGNSHGAVVFRDGKGEHEIENSFGSVGVEGNSGTMTIRDANGSVSVKNVTGAVTIENRFGSITAATIGDDLTIHGGNGSVSVTDAGGALRVTNSFGSVVANRVRSRVDIVNSNGKIEVRDIKGDAKLKTSFGSVTFVNVGGNVVSDSDNSRVIGDTVSGTVAIRNTFGSVDLRNAGASDIVNHNGATTAIDIRGAVQVDARFGLVKLQRIGGNVKVTNGNGGVNASGIAGNSIVTTSFAPVFLEGVRGSVDVTNQNGSVSVDLESEARGNCQDISIESSFGSIELNVPDSANYDVSARTSFARITSDLPILATSTDENRLSGKLGKGGCRARLSNSNGSIRIK